MLFWSATLNVSLMRFQWLLPFTAGLLTKFYSGVDTEVGEIKQLVLVQDLYQVVVELNIVGAAMVQRAGFRRI